MLKLILIVIEWTEHNISNLPGRCFLGDDWSITLIFSRQTHMNCHRSRPDASYFSQLVLCAFFFSFLALSLSYFNLFYFQRKFRSFFFLFCIRPCFVWVMMLVSHLKFSTKKYALIEVKHFSKALRISCSLHLRWCLG